MEAQLQELVSQCNRGINNLRDQGYSCLFEGERTMTRCHGQNFDSWKELLEETAQGIEMSGSFLFARDFPFNDLRVSVNIQSLVQHTEALISLGTDLPSGLGHHYSQHLRQAIISTLTALTRLPDLWAALQNTHRQPAPFAWNQTIRLRDIPPHCVTHLMLRWERWGCRIREASEELKCPGFAPDDVSETDIGDDASLINPLRREINAVLRVIRNLFKKIRVRCVVSLCPQTHVAVVDQLYGLGEQMPNLVEDLVMYLTSPPLNLPLLCGLAVEVVKQAERILEVALHHVAETHRKSLGELPRQLDLVLLPLLERNPDR